MIPFSVLDLAPVPQGADVSQAFHNSLSLAQHAEALGYHRFWLAEHHNMPGIASAATAVVIGHVAAGTRTIRVGSGGIMLPNHAPLMVAEHSARWKRCSPDASTSAWAGRPGPTSGRPARSAGTWTRMRTASRRMSSSYRVGSSRRRLGRRCARCRERG
jgi:hypothetical protein